MVRSHLAQVGVRELPGAAPHLRHVTLAADADLRAVAARLGHASTATTESYAEHAEMVKDSPVRYL